MIHWGTLSKYRSHLKPSDIGDIRVESVRLTRRTDRKTGAVTIGPEGGGRIDVTRHLQFPWSAVGIKNGLSLFTWTSKMACPSFSLPAGPPAARGTCPASVKKDVIADGSYRQFHPGLNGSYVCETCYAGKNNYLQYKNISIGQMARYFWTVRALKRGTFVVDMTRAISALSSDRKYRDLLASINVSTDYFRIHDSGEFFDPEYYLAWCDVADNLPDVKFWAPTRLWVFSDWRDQFLLNPPPRNFALRPSSLSVGARPPKIPGMDPGSGVHGDPGSASVFECPAFEETDDPLAGTCTTSVGIDGRKPCRECWRKRNAVSYLEH